MEFHGPSLEYGISVTKFIPRYKMKLLTSFEKWQWYPSFTPRFAKTHQETDDFYSAAFPLAHLKMFGQVLLRSFTRFLTTHFIFYYLFSVFDIFVTCDVLLKLSHDKFFYLECSILQSLSEQKFLTYPPSVQYDPSVEATSLFRST